MHLPIPTDSVGLLRVGNQTGRDCEPGSASRSRPKRIAGLLVAVAVSGAVLVSGCTSDDDVKGQDSTTASTTSTSAPGASTTDKGTSSTDTSTAGGSGTSQEGSVNAQRAIEIALAEAPDSAVVEVDHHSTGGASGTWEVVVVNPDQSGTEFRIDVADGRIISTGPEGLDPEARTPPAVTAQRAIEIALGAVPGELLELDLDTERGRVVWEAEVRPETGRNQEITIDAASGEILKQENA